MFPRTIPRCGSLVMVHIPTISGVNQTKQGIISYNKIQLDALFLNFVVVKNSICFGQTYCPSSGVLILYSEQLVFVILVVLTVC